MQEPPENTHRRTYSFSPSKFDEILPRISPSKVGNLSSGYSNFTNNEIHGLQRLHSHCNNVYSKRHYKTTSLPVREPPKASFSPSSKLGNSSTLVERGDHINQHRIVLEEKVFHASPTKVERKSKIPRVEVKSFSMSNDVTPRNDNESHYHTSNNKENCNVGGKRRSQANSIENVETETEKKSRKRMKGRAKTKRMLMDDFMKEMEKERDTLKAQWKEEFESAQTFQEDKGALNHFGSACQFMQSRVQHFFNSALVFFSLVEVFISNMPLTIGAVGLSWVTMGVVWFKFTEEMLPECVPTHYRSLQCTFQEFPGCFSGEGCMESPTYVNVLIFHYFCHAVAGFCCLIFLLKVLLAWRVVADELSDPTKSTPMGVVCITMVCVFAGRGVWGEVVVLVTSIFHVLLAFWFCHMSHKYRMLPDPSWFPNTVGLAYASIKTWLYFPFLGKMIMLLSGVFFFATFFISVIRVLLNRKISAPVCWIQLSAPSITLYTFTLMQQPSKVQEEAIELSAEKMDNFMEVHHDLYLPLQHLVFTLTIVGMTSALHALISRWDSFKTKPFSPAHAAFCFPTLSHANSVQVYRGAINAFSTIADDCLFKQALWLYWVVLLVVGSAVNIIFTYKYIVRLPKWTKVDLLGEEETPPAPGDTLMAQEILADKNAGDRLNQPFVSPAILQANEAGSLVRIRRGTEDYRLHGDYIRTRHIASLGFDLTMNDNELREERARLLDWVARNAPRTRNRTHSQPIVTSNITISDGRGVYGAVQDRDHRRSNTFHIFNINGSGLA